MLIIFLFLSVDCLFAGKPDDFPETYKNSDLKERWWTAATIYERTPDRKKESPAKYFFTLTATKKEKQIVNNFISTVAKEILPEEPYRTPGRIYNELYNVDFSEESCAESYFFSEDGKFNYRSYYLGGPISNVLISGTYIYDAEFQTITLKEDASYSFADDYVNPFSAEITISGVTDSMIIVNKQPFSKEKRGNIFILFGSRITIDSMAIFASINNKLFGDVPIEPENYKWLTPLFSQIDTLQTTDTDMIEDAIELYVIIKHQVDNRSVDLIIKILPELNLIEYEHKRYILESNPYMTQFKKALSTCLGKEFVGLKF